MTYGAYALNTIQLGREASAGSIAAATVVWRGPAVDIEDQTETVMVEEDTGLLLPGTRSYQAKKQAVLAMPETELTFEQVLHLLEGGIKTASPTGTGPYTYVYAFPTSTTFNTIKTYTLETGNANAGDASYMLYGFVEEMSFSGAAGEAWKMAGTWRGRQRVVKALTAAPALTAVEEALFSKTKLYIEAAAGTHGTTNKAGVLVSANVTIKTGVQPVWTADGQIYFYAHKFVRPEVTWSLSFELESGGLVAAERAAWAAQSLRLIELDCPGTDATRNLKFDLVGKYTSIGTYNNQDGNTIVEASGVCTFDATDTEYCTITVVNNVATVP